jgi:hypothetical protein
MMVLISCFAVAFCGTDGLAGAITGAGAGVADGSTGNLYPPFLLMVIKYSLVDAALKFILLGGIPFSRLNSVFHSNVVNILIYPVLWQLRPVIFIFP